ncbi:hypothetical protein J4417_00225 [Candidatus Woesearchaeota archaeon]|nr:hypothetical protein [Candidatus Woesearchaeota archaeon]
MNKSIISIATVLMGLTSGCQDAKLKECMAKVEKLEDAFGNTCEWKSKYYDGSPELNRLDKDLYEIVEHRNEIWAASGCGAYRASWVCDYIGKDSLGGGKYSVDFDYEKMEE